MNFASILLSNSTCAHYSKDGDADARPVISFGDADFALDGTDNAGPTCFKYYDKSDFFFTPADETVTDQWFAEGDHMWDQLPGRDLCGANPGALGRAVPVNSIKTRVQSCCKLKYYKMLSTVALKFSVRHYSSERSASRRGWCRCRPRRRRRRGTLCRRRRHSRQGLTLVHFSAQLKRILWDRGACRGCSGGV